MKKLYFILSSVFLSLGISKAQTATSITNGNWTSPFTWNCTCVPTPGYNVTVAHNVTLNTNFGYTTGSITVNSGASLLDDPTGRSMFVGGGSFANNGTCDFKNLLVQTAAFSNAGVLSSIAYANFVNYTNTGTVQNVDSFYNSAILINNGNFLNIDSITNNGTLTNNGTSTYHLFTNLGTYINNNMMTVIEFTNTGTYTNSDSIICTDNFANAEIFNNTATGNFFVSKTFLNGDLNAHNAVFTNSGIVKVSDSWYNSDTVKGSSGRFTVQDTSFNSGFMKGNFDFCDLTPPATSPFVDLNYGTISPFLTYCSGVGLKENNFLTCSLYPNPASSELFVETSFQLDNSSVCVYNFIGMEVIKVQKPSGQKIKIETSDLSDGIYFFSIKNGSEVITKRFVK